MKEEKEKLTGTKRGVKYFDIGKFDHYFGRIGVMRHPRMLKIQDRFCLPNNFCKISLDANYFFEDISGDKGLVLDLELVHPLIEEEIKWIIDTRMEGVSRFYDLSDWGDLRHIKLIGGRGHTPMRDYYTFHCFIEGNNKDLMIGEQVIDRIAHFRRSGKFCRGRVSNLEFYLYNKVFFKVSKEDIEDSENFILDAKGNEKFVNGGKENFLMFYNFSEFDAIDSLRFIDKKISRSTNFKELVEIIPPVSSLDSFIVKEKEKFDRSMLLWKKEQLKKRREEKIRRKKEKINYIKKDVEFI